MTLLALLCLLTGAENGVIRCLELGLWRLLEWDFWLISHSELLKVATSVSHHVWIGPLDKRVLSCLEVP